MKRNTIQRQLVIAAVRFLADHPTADPYPAAQTGLTICLPSITTLNVPIAENL